MQIRKNRPARTKGGWVYVGESKRRDGTKMHYVGSTTRDVKTREKEHKREVKKKDSNTWVGQGSSYKTIGSFWSKNPRADEKKVKTMGRSKRKKLLSSKRTRSTTRKNTISESPAKKRNSSRKKLLNSAYKKDRFGRIMPKNSSDYAKERISGSKTMKSTHQAPTKKKGRKTSTKRKTSTRRSTPKRFTSGRSKTRSSSYRRR